MNTYKKDPSAVLDYQFDWTDWLATSETIATKTITASTGLTVDSSTIGTGTVTVWLSSGTAGTKYTVACLITTNQGRTDERSITIQCLNR